MLYVDSPENRIIWMDFPAPERIATLSDELHQRHADCFMVWNLSGTSYDEQAFGGRVVSLRFSGHLCPPLLMLVEACLSIQAWLSADPANIVAVHCRTGRGRSAVLLCCMLAWRQSGGLSRALSSPGGGGPRSPLDWLSHLAQVRGQDENVLTLPSHRRYLHYFGALLGGARPSGGAQQLRSIVLHSMPPLAALPVVTVARGNRVLYTSSEADVTTLPPAAGEKGGGGGSYACAPPRDASGVPLLIREDMTLSVRAAAAVAEGGGGGGGKEGKEGREKEGPLLFRAAFHVDLIPTGGVLRLPRSQLDGVVKEMPHEAFVDVMVSADPLAVPGAAPAPTPLWRAIDELCSAGGVARAGGLAEGNGRRPKARFSLEDDDDDDDADDNEGGEGGEGSAAALAPPPGGFPPPPPRRPSGRQLLEELGVEMEERKSGEASPEDWRPKGERTDIAAAPSAAPSTAADASSRALRPPPPAAAPPTAVPVAIPAAPPPAADAAAAAAAASSAPEASTSPPQPAAAATAPAPAPAAAPTPAADVEADLEAEIEDVLRDDDDAGLGPLDDGSDPLGDAGAGGDGAVDDLDDEFDKLVGGD